MDHEFKSAVDLYRSGHYSDALPVFRKIAVELPFNQKTTIAYLFTAKSYLQMNDLDSAKNYLRSFLEKFRGSEDVDEARLALVKVFYRQEDYNEAFDEILRLISDAKLPGYKNYADSIGQTLSIQYLGLNQLKKIYNTTTDSTVKSFLLFLIAQKLEKDGNFNLASETCEQLIQFYPESNWSEEAKKSLSRLENLKNEYKFENLLGVLLPLTDYKTGEQNGAAGEILEGIKYATAEYNMKHQDKIGLLIRDTENDSSKISMIANELSPVPAIKAIIGPVFSDEVRATLNDFRNSGIPIISPTATDNDLVKLSNYFFQANPSFYMRAKVMAQYIYFVTGKKKIAVLNAGQGYSPLLASMFSNEFKNLGGEIINERSYISGSFDLTESVSAIAADSLIMEGIYVPPSSGTRTGFMPKVLKPHRF